MSSFGLRMSVFVLMTISYILFLIALVERFAILPSSKPAPAFSSSQLGSTSPSSSSPTAKSYPPFIQEDLHEPFKVLPHNSVLSSGASAEGIEICGSDIECYTYYPGIAPKRSALGNLEPAVTRSTGHVIRSVSSWAWSVLRGGIRHRGTRRMQKRRRLGVIESTDAL